MKFLKSHHGLWVALGGVVLIAACFRLIGLDKVPPSLNWDEASLGYNAFSILKTGHDEWGKLLPMSFEAFGEYKLPGYIYTSVPSIALFGLNEFAVRFPSALFGTLTVLLASLIVYEMTKSRVAAISAGLLLAITPWHVFVSREALEANLALFFIVLGVYCFILAMRTKPSLYLVSMASFVASIYTYNSARVFTPLFVIALIFFFRKAFFARRSIAIASLALFIGLFAIVVPFALREGNARLADVTILDQGGINRIEEQRNLSPLPDPIKRLVFNRPVYFAETTIKNYLTYFSPTYLFFEGGSQYQFSVPHFGLLYLVELPLLLFGIWELIRTKNRFRVIPIVWLLLAPIPAAITRETPHALRSLFMLPTFEIMSAIGFTTAFLSLRRMQSYLPYVFTFFILAAITVQAIPYFQNYFMTYPKTYACTWQYGHKQMVDYLIQHKDDYDKILITKRYGEPHIFVLFYQGIDPKSYYEDPALIRYHESNHDWVDQFGKYLFVNDWELQTKLTSLVDQNVGKILVVTSPSNYPSNLSQLDSIRYPNGQEVFSMLPVDSRTTKIHPSDLHPPKPERGCDYE